MSILTKLEKNINFWILFIISAIFFLLRFPSLFEPEWYGDEGIYQVLGLGINAGRLLYRDIFDNKPPLLYLLYSFVGSDQAATRFLSLAFGLVSIWLLFFVAKKVLVSTKAALFTSGIFALLFGLPLIEGNIANAENFMLPLNIASGLLILISLKIINRKKTNLVLCLSGLILGLSFLFKIVAVFDFAAFFIFLLFVQFPGNIKDLLKPKTLIGILEKLSAFSFGFLLPIALTTLFFVANNSLEYFLKAVLFNNVGYVGYGNKFIIPQGLLIFKLLILLIFTIFIFLKRNTYEKGFTFISLWLGFSLFNVLFSQRPYVHYVLVILPSLSLMFGLVYLNNKYSKLAGVIALSTLIVILMNFRFYTKIFPYYINFVSFVTNHESVYNYRYFFDHSTPRDYQIADYILINKKKDISTFIWGNNAPVYNLIGQLPPGRYTVAYHITNYSDGYDNTRLALEKKPPQFIVIMPNVPDYPFSLSMYDLKINLGGANIYERINN